MWLQRLIWSLLVSLPEHGEPRAAKRSLIYSEALAGKLALFRLYIVGQTHGFLLELPQRRT